MAYVLKIDCDTPVPFIKEPVYLERVKKYGKRPAGLFPATFAKATHFKSAIEAKRILTTTKLAWYFQNVEKITLQEIKAPVDIEEFKGPFEVNL